MVTATLLVTLFVVPVVNEAVVDPYVKVWASFQVEVPLHVVSTGATSIVLVDPGAEVIRTLSVAESAPPVAGMLQLERSKRTSDHRRCELRGETERVVLPPFDAVGLFSSTYVSVVEA